MIELYQLFLLQTQPVIITPITGPIRTALVTDDYQPPDVGGPRGTSGSGTR